MASKKRLQERLEDGPPRQFKSEHCLEAGGTEKFYFALVHGEAQVPCSSIERTTYPRVWKVEPSGAGGRRRGRIEITMRFVRAKWKAFPFTHGAVEGWAKPGEEEEGTEQGEWEGPLEAITFYEPVAWFSDTEGKRRARRREAFRLQVHAAALADHYRPEASGRRCQSYFEAYFGLSHASGTSKSICQQHVMGLGPQTKASKALYDYP